MLDSGILIAMFGLYPDAFTIGLVVAGLWATSQEQLNTRWKTGSVIALYALAAGLIAGPAAAYVRTKYIPELSADAIRPGIALVISLFAPYGIKRVIAILKPKEGDKP